MRTIRPVLARNAEIGDGRIDAFGQRGQFGAGMNSDPEYARSLRRREESVSANANFERSLLSTPTQTFSNRLDLLRFLLSDEFQRDVQRFWTNPARIRRETLNALEEARDTASDFRVEIDTNEYSHLCITDLTHAYKSARRIISSACCVAN